MNLTLKTLRHRSGTRHVFTGFSTYSC